MSDDYDIDPAEFRDWFVDKYGGSATAPSTPETEPPPKEELTDYIIKNSVKQIDTVDHVISILAAQAAASGDPRLLESLAMFIDSKNKCMTNLQKIQSECEKHENSMKLASHKETLKQSTEGVKSVLRNQNVISATRKELDKLFFTEEKSLDGSKKKK